MKIDSTALFQVAFLTLFSTAALRDAVTLAAEAPSPPLPNPTITRSLDGQWLVATDPKNVGREQRWWQQPVPEAKVAKVPQVMQATFPAYFGAVWYWRELAVPLNPHPGGRYLLRFWDVDYLADVWLNGTQVGTHEGSQCPFGFDVTDAIKPGSTNRLALRL